MASNQVSEEWKNAQKDGGPDKHKVTATKVHVEPITGIKVLGFGAIPAVVEKMKQTFINDFKFDPASSVIHVADESNKPGIVEALKVQKWDVVMIGRGVSSDPIFLAWIVNAIVTISPGTRVALPEDPTDALQAVSRAYREKY